MPFTGVVMATADDPVQRSYKDGVKYGEWVEFDANGLVKTKAEYSEGQIRKIIGFENGKETTEERYKYYENGKLSFKWNHIDGKEHGLQEFFKKDGSFLFSNNYENGIKVSDLTPLKQKHSIQAAVGSLNGPSRYIARSFDLILMVQAKSMDA